MSTERTLERALTELKHLLWACNTAMMPWTDHDESTDGEEKTWEHRYSHLRRVLLKFANDIVDQYGPVNEANKVEETYPNRRMRVEQLWSVYSTMLENWGIVRTADGKLFTFTETTGAPSAD